MPVVASSTVDQESSLSSNKDDDNDDESNAMFESGPSPSTRRSSEISNKRVFPLYEPFPSSSYMSPTQPQTSRFSPSVNVRENSHRRLFSADRDAEPICALPTCSVTQKSESPPPKRPRTSAYDGVEYNAAITPSSSLFSDNRPFHDGAPSTKLPDLTSGSLANHRGNHPALNRRIENSLPAYGFEGSHLEVRDLGGTDRSDVEYAGSVDLSRNVPSDTEGLIIDLTNMEESDSAEEEEEEFSLRSPASSPDSFREIRFRNDTPIPERGLTIPCPLSIPAGYPDVQPYNREVTFEETLRDWNRLRGLVAEARDIVEPQPFEDGDDHFEETLGVWSRLRGIIEEDTVMPQRSEQRVDHTHPTSSRHISCVSQDIEPRIHRRPSRHHQPTSSNVTQTETHQQYPYVVVDRLRFPSALPAPTVMSSLPFPSYHSNGAHVLPGALSVAAPLPTQISPVLTARNRLPGTTPHLQPTNPSLYSSNRHFLASSPGTDHTHVLRPIPSLQQAHSTRPGDHAAHPYTQRLSGTPVPHAPTFHRGGAHAFPVISSIYRPSHLFQPSRHIPVSSSADRPAQFLNNNNLNGEIPRRPGFPVSLTIGGPVLFTPPRYLSPHRIATETNTTDVSSVHYTPPRRPPLFNPWQYLPSTSSMRSDASRREPTIPNTSLNPQPVVTPSHPAATPSSFLSALSPPPLYHDYYLTDPIPPPSPQGVLNSPVETHPFPFPNTRMNRLWMPLHPYVSLEDESDSNPFNVFLSLAEGLGGVKPQGLSKGRIDQLSSYRYKPGTHRTDQPMCVVCMCEWEPKDHIRVLPCDHEFHAKCVDRWLKKNSTCPICRGDAGQCETSAPPVA